ncbi:MAG: hypothetical protein ABH834_04460 [Candidatus Altiarchaeota archaeon]
MVWRHLSTALLVAGLLMSLTGLSALTLHVFCSYVQSVRECHLAGLKPLLIIPGMVFLAASLFLFSHKDAALSDVESILRYHEIDSHCPACYTQGVVKKSGFFTNKMICPKCKRQWRILDL